ncbi:hypothetical protein J6590_008116 [Homalodisca vitripennis]|nr:hypothetical protein J6590_056447 [Homalodisca vitripennis]KAG8273991.1 hypothetical protein J6590_008116 [Homalodisca vitripennis]
MVLDCSDLLAMIGFRVPRMTRSAELFVHNYYQNNYLKFVPVKGLHRLVNFVPAEVDFFCNSLETSKRNGCLHSAKCF